MKDNQQRITEYSEFWDHYVSEHSRPMTRYLHFFGTGLGIGLLIWFLWIGAYFYIPLSFVVGYAFAWFSHFVIEKNKPASFKYPFWSFISDYKMMFYMVAGKMNAEVGRIKSAARSTGT